MRYKNHMGNESCFKQSQVLTLYMLKWNSFLKASSIWASFAHSQRVNKNLLHTYERFKTKSYGLRPCCRAKLNLIFHHHRWKFSLTRAIQNGRRFPGIPVKAYDGYGMRNFFGKPPGKNDINRVLAWAGFSGHHNFVLRHNQALFPQGWAGQNKILVWRK